MNVKQYRICHSVRVWNNQKNGFVNQISYIKDYSPCEIDLTANKHAAQMFSLKRAQEIVDWFNLIDKSEGSVCWAEEIV